MKKTACIKTVLLIFLCFFTNFAWGVNVSLNLQRGEEIARTYVYHQVTCGEYKYYSDTVIRKPSFIEYDTTSVKYRGSAAAPSCHIDIRYSIQTSPNAPPGVYSFSVKYTVYHSPTNYNVTLDFTIGIDVADISVSPDSFSMFTVTKSFDSPGVTPEGLAFDGTYLWHGDTINDKIYQLDTSGNIVSSFKSPNVFPGGLAFDGTYLWCADFVYAIIYKLDTSGNILASFDFAGTSPEGLAFDGTYLWTVDSWDNKIYKLATSGEVIATYDSPADVPSGLAFDGTYLWLSDWNTDKIIKLDTAGNVITFFDVPFTSPEGLAFQGVHLWIADSSEGSINRMAIPYVGTSVRQTYTAKNNGFSALHISSVTVTGTNAAEFRIQHDTCSKHAITPSGTCTFDAVFSPTEEGEKSATIEITSNDPDTPILEIPISGRAEINTRLEQVKAFVTRFYELCLGRSPDRAGLDGWVSALLDGIQTGSDVAYGFVFSPEFLAKNTNNDEYLQVLYEAFFNRPPDAAGKQGWLDAIQNGASREDVLNGFIYAVEFAELCEEYGIKAYEEPGGEPQRRAVEAFVSRFYQQCLNRSPERDGLDGWTNELLGGTRTGADVAFGFVFSPEFIGRNTSNEDYLTILYSAFFDRDPDPAGWDVWLDELNRGTSREAVLNGFVYATEFAELCDRYCIRAFEGHVPDC